MKKLTKKQMRVVIAKDALTQLRAEKYAATKGIYIDDNLLSSLRDTYNKEGNICAQSSLSSLKKCKVCAKGAIYLSTVRKFNDVKLERFCNDSTNKANEIFGETLLNKVERAFEKWTDMDKRYIETNSNLNKFINKYPDRNIRLEKILLNIIRNKGVFKP